MGLYGLEVWTLKWMERRKKNMKPIHSRKRSLEGPERPRGAEVVLQNTVVQVPQQS